MDRADAGADQQSADNGDDPDHRVPKAQNFRQDPDLNDRHRHGAEAHDRAHRQVDMAGDDDQHHAGCHHADRSGLDREVPKVSRGQKRAEAVDQLAVKVEADPDEGERAQHAQQSRVNLGRAQKPGKEWFVFDPGCLFCPRFFDELHHLQPL